MHWRSKLIHPDRQAPSGFRSLVVPVYRGSTVLFENQAAVQDDWRQDKIGYTYGLYGSPTVLELAGRIASLERARHSIVTPGGQASIALIYLAFCGAGSHVLLPENAYGPNRELAEDLLLQLGVVVECYDPLTGSGIDTLIRPNTKLIWCESPGSVTMEIQDIPAIVAAAHSRGVLVALDNTYSAGILLDAFSLGVDIGMQALTKYVGGHSDLLLGTVSTNDRSCFDRLGTIHRQLGMAVSPDDCGLALRGLQTLGLRLEHLERSTLEIAQWLSKHSAVKTMLHPAFQSCPGHEIWKRDFSGSASVFSVEFDERYSLSQINAFLDSLTLFKAGYSWGGVTSLAVSYPELERTWNRYEGVVVRFNIGLEEPADLILDLDRGLGLLASGLAPSIATPTTGEK